MSGESAGTVELPVELVLEVGRLLRGLRDADHDDLVGWSQPDVVTLLERWPGEFAGEAEGR